MHRIGRFRLGCFFPWSRPSFFHNNYNSRHLQPSYILFEFAKIPFRSCLQPVLNRKEWIVTQKIPGFGDISQGMKGYVRNWAS